MNVTTILISELPKVYKYAKADLAKRYDLLEDFELNLNMTFPAVYDSKYLYMIGSKLIVKAYRNTPSCVICDGATLVPEEILGMPMVIGALVHDPLYRELEAWAKQMGWSLKKARKFADTVYGNILRDIASRQTAKSDKMSDKIVAKTKQVAGKAWAHISYSGVRTFGGVAHWAYLNFVKVLILVFGVMIAGGCMEDLVNPDWQPPQYEQVGK